MTLTLFESGDSIRIAIPKLDYLARGTNEGMLSVSRISPFRVLWQVPCAHQGAITSIAWSHDGRLLASGGADRMIHVWYALSSARLCSFASDQEVIERLQWSRGGRLRASSGSFTQLFPSVVLQHMLAA